MRTGDGRGIEMIEVRHAGYRHEALPGLNLEWKNFIDHEHPGIAPNITRYVLLIQSWHQRCDNRLEVVEAVRNAAWEVERIYKQGPRDFMVKFQNGIRFCFTFSVRGFRLRLLGIDEISYTNTSYHLYKPQ